MAGVVHHPGDGPHLAELIDTQVAGHHRGTPAERLVSVAAEPAAQIQHQVTGAQSQPVVVGGQHDPVRGVCLSSRARYWSTVRSAVWCQLH